MEEQTLIEKNKTEKEFSKDEKWKQVSNREQKEKTKQGHKELNKEILEHDKKCKNLKQIITKKVKKNLPIKVHIF